MILDFLDFLNRRYRQIHRRRLKKVELKKIKGIRQTDFTPIRIRTSSAAQMRDTSFVLYQTERTDEWDVRIGDLEAFRIWQA